MMTAVRQTATVQADGRLNLAVPELAPGTVTEVIVLVPTTRSTTPVLTPAERVSALNGLRAQSNLTEEQARQWIEEVRLERLAWPMRGEPLE